MLKNLLIIIFLAYSLKGVAQNTFAGMYRAKTQEKDSASIFTREVAHQLKLNTDSSFTYSKKTGKRECDNIYAGFWKIQKGQLILDFVGDDPLALNLKSGAEGLMLENMHKGLRFFKFEPGKKNFDNHSGPGKGSQSKGKEPKCPSF
jgi:hypothetical protein